MFLKLVLAGNGVSVLNKPPTFEEPPRLVNSPDESDEVHEEDESSEEGGVQGIHVPEVPRVRISSSEKARRDQLNLLREASDELAQLIAKTKEELKVVEMSEEVEEYYSNTSNLRKYSLFGC
jgi:flagellar motility protein MotE (MotC chaperone)